MANNTVNVTVTGKDRFSPEIKKAQDSADGFGASLSNIGKTAAIAFAAVGAAAIATGAVALKFGGDFNDAFNTIKVGTGETGDALEGLKDDFRAVARTAPQGIGTVAQVIADLNTRLGITGGELQTTSKQFLDFARVNKVEVGGAVRDVTRLMNALGMQAGDASELMDKLTRAGQLSGIGVDRLTQLVTEAGPAFEELGFGLDHSIALFAQMEKVGARPEELLSSLNLALNTLAREGFTNAEDAFAEYMKRIQEAPDILQATVIANELFGARAGSKIAADLREGVFAVEEWTAAIAGAGGTMEALADDTLKLGERFSILKNNVLVGMEPAFMKVFDAAERLMIFFSETAMPVVAGFASILSGSLFKSSVQNVGGFEKLEGSMTKWGIKVMEVGRMVRAFAIDVVIPAFEAIADFVTGTLVPVIRDEIAPVVMRFVQDVLGALVHAFKNDVKPILETVAGIIVDHVIPAVLSLGNFVKDNLLPPIKAFIEFLANHKEFLAGFALVITAKLVVAFIAWATAAGAAAVATILATAPIIAITLAIAALVGGIIWMVRNWDEAKDAMGRFGNFVWGKVKPAVDALWSAVQALINPLQTVIDLFSRLPSPGSIASGVGGGAVNLAQSLNPFGGGRAAGGPVQANTPYLVGENGPELRVFGSPGHIIPNHALGGGGTTNNYDIDIHISGLITDPVATGREVARALNKAVASGGPVLVRGAMQI